MLCSLAASVGGLVERTRPEAALVHSESASRSRNLVPATGNKVAHAIAEREAREAGDQNKNCEVGH